MFFSCLRNSFTWIYVTIGRKKSVHAHIVWVIYKCMPKWVTIQVITTH